MGEFRIGCAGWHYADWVGPVYAAHLAPAGWLRAYAGLFPTVEVDSTFYALPGPATVRGWIDRVRGRPAFSFAAKVPQEATHRLLARGRPEAAAAVAGEFLDRVARPLEQAGRFEAALAQLPPSFARSTTALAHLQHLLRALEPGRRHVAVEFRHPSWFTDVGGPLEPEAAEALGALAVAVVHVDGLGFRPTPTRTTNWSYVRLHGRRTDIPPQERGLSHAPYNYLYSASELDELAATIRSLSAAVDRTVVILNNHYEGKSARNAVDLAARLGLPPPPASMPLKPERALDAFGASPGARGA